MPPTAAAARRAIVVMGVSASGKTSVGTILARRLGLDFVDGDDLHPDANVEKMRGGHPLDDADRWPWLDRVGAALADTTHHPSGVVIACSALRRIYRERIRAAAGAGLVFLFLDLSPEEAHRRSENRKGHYMPPSLVDSQFATLDRPEGEADVVTVGPHASAEATAAAAFEALRL